MNMFWLISTISALTTLSHTKGGKKLYLDPKLKFNEVLKEATETRPIGVENTEVNDSILSLGGNNILEVSGNEVVKTVFKDSKHPESDISALDSVNIDGKEDGITFKRTLMGSKGEFKIMQGTRCLIVDSENRLGVADQKFCRGNDSKFELVNIPDKDVPKTGQAKSKPASPKTDSTKKSKAEGQKEDIPPSMPTEKKPEPDEVFADPVYKDKNEHTIERKKASKDNAIESAVNMQTEYIKQLINHEQKLQEEVDEIKTSIVGQKRTASEEGDSSYDGSLPGPAPEKKKTHSLAKIARSKIFPRKGSSHAKQESEPDDPDSENNSNSVKVAKAKTFPQKSSNRTKQEVSPEDPEKNNGVDSATNLNNKFDALIATLNNVLPFVNQNSSSQPRLPVASAQQPVQSQAAPAAYSQPTGAYLPADASQPLSPNPITQQQYAVAQPFASNPLQTSAAQAENVAASAQPLNPTPLNYTNQVAGAASRPFFNNPFSSTSDPNSTPNPRSRELKKEAGDLATGFFQEFLNKTFNIPTQHQHSR